MVGGGGAGASATPSAAVPTGRPPVSNQLFSKERKGILLELWTFLFLYEITRSQTVRYDGYFLWSNEMYNYSTFATNNKFLLSNVAH